MSSAAASQAMLNQQGLFEEQDMGFFTTTFPQNLDCHHQSLIKPFNLTPHDHQPAQLHPPPTSAAATSNTLTRTLISSQKHKPHLAPDFVGPQLLSLQRSTANFWAWGGGVKECLGSKKMGVGGEDHHHHHLGVSTMKMKRIKARRKVREPRFCFKTMSDVDVLDDGYKWRKYGQKVVKNTQHPRSYYRCTQDNCRVKKRVERLAEDPRMVITTYEGRHVHSPSQDLDGDSTQPLNSQLSNFFW